jgi:hypothetical protein
MGINESFHGKISPIMNPKYKSCESDLHCDINEHRKEFISSGGLSFDIKKVLEGMNKM